MAAIIQRGDCQYQAKIRKAGFPTISKTFPTRKLADQWAKVTESEMIRGEFVQRKAVQAVTLDKALEKYGKERSSGKKGEAQELVRINQLRRHSLAKLIVSQVQPEDIEDYIVGRRQTPSKRDPSKKVSDATIRLEVMLLSAVFEACKSKKWNYCRSNPVREIDEEFRLGKSKERTRRFVGDEEKRFFKALEARCKSKTGNPDILLVARLALITAARQSELIGKPATSKRPAHPGLSWPDVNLAHRSATLRDTKNGKDRVIPLFDNAHKLLSSLPHPINGGKVLNVTQDGLIRAISAACEAAGIEDFVFHDLRHEATSRMVEAGLSLLEVQSITGHSNAEMVKRYTHLNMGKLAKKMRQS